MIVHGHVQAQPVGGFVTDGVVQIVVNLVTRVGVLDTVLIGTGTVEDRPGRVGVHALSVRGEAGVECTAIRVQQNRPDAGATMGLQQLHTRLGATQLTE